MKRTTLAVCLAFLISASPLASQPKVEEKAPQQKLDNDHVVLKAAFYEVDDAYYRKLVKASQWRSKADLEELENKPQDPSLFKALDKQKLLLAGKELKVNTGEEAVVLALTREVRCLANPEDLQKGRRGSQIFQEGVSLRAKVQFSPDRRFVRASLVEKSLEVEGTEKVTVAVGKDKEAPGEIASVKEGSVSETRWIADGGSLLLAIQYRPRDARANDRWLVAVVSPRIIIAEEERELKKRGQDKK